MRENLFRAQAIRLLKRTIRWLNDVPVGAKLLRLVAEQYTVNQAADATQAADQALRATLSPVVLRGPCAQLRYPSHAAVGSTYWPKLLGSYECELAPAIEDMISHGYAHVVDIGAAEGYYAVGLAVRMPSATVIAFEGNPLGQKLLREMAALNGVTVRVEGWCDIDTLRRTMDEIPSGRTLILCDAESAEYDLLDIDSVPALGACDMIVELHRRGTIPDPRTWIATRFGGTHDIVFVESEPRLPSMYPELQVLAPSQRSPVLFERTDPFGWAVLSSRTAQ